MARVAMSLIVVLALTLGARAEERAAMGNPEGSHGAPEDAGGRHGGEHGEGMKPFWMMFLIQVIGFALLVWVLAKFAGPGIRRGLNERRDRFAQAYEGIRKDTEEVERLVRELSSKLANIEHEARARLERAVAEATALRAEMVAEGKAQANELAAKAKREIDLETAIAIAEIKLEVVERAVAAARASLAKGVDPDVQRALVNEAIDELGALREVTFA